MSLFIEFHLIQNFAPSNLNRDDTGAPKDALFGGHRRARVSSQCFKRAIRLAAQEYELVAPEFRGVRTKKLKTLLLDRLVDRDPLEAEGKIEIALAAAGLKLKDDGKTEYLLFLGEAEITGFAQLIEQHWDELAGAPAGGEKKGKKEAKASAPAEVVKKAKALLDGGKAVDVALFGRMLADMPEVNQDVRLLHRGRRQGRPGRDWGRDDRPGGIQFCDSLPLRGGRCRQAARQPAAG
jgi:CRISPR system Cascade subunit CasC